MSNPSTKVTSLESLPGYNTVAIEPLKSYVGIKTLDSSPMTLGNYNQLRGWSMPKDEDPAKDGYLVVYSDGHVSWSPKETFEDSYSVSGNYSYSMALYLVQTQSHLGAAMYRAGWNGKGMWVLEIDGDTLSQGINRNYGDPANPDNNSDVAKALFLKNAQGQLFPWFPSQGDTNATDWCVMYQADTCK